MAGLSYPCYYAYKSQASQWRWTYHASHTKIIAVGSESYASKADCLQAIRMMKGSSRATVYTTE